MRWTLLFALVGLVACKGGDVVDDTVADDTSTDDTNTDDTSVDDTGTDDTSTETDPCDDYEAPCVFVDLSLIHI